LNRTNPKRGRLLVALTALNIVFVLALYVAETYIAERNWLTTLVTYAPQQFFVIPSLILLAWSLVGRNRMTIAANVAGALFVAFTLLGFNVPVGGGGCSGPRVRIMTYNVHHGAFGAAAIARAVRTLRPDIACLQEANPFPNKPDPLVELRRLLPEWHFAADGQLVLFSRYPISHSEAHPAPVDYWRVIFQATVATPGRRLTIVNLHMSTAAHAESIMDHRGSLPTYLRNTAVARSMQVTRLLNVTRDIKGPLIVVGDFNTPPRGRFYRRMCGQFTDSFAASGWGCGYTFRANTPVMRIDYVFVRGGLCPVACRVPAMPPASDHRPVVADIAFEK
jgi:vancomycin resistance protein VanJ